MRKNAPHTDPTTPSGGENAHVRSSGSLPPDDFPQVLDAAGQGDERAWEILYSMIGHTVRRLAAWGHVSDADTDDVTQNVAVKVLLRYPMNDWRIDGSSFHAWIYVVARNVLIDMRRKTARQSVLPVFGVSKWVATDNTIEVEIAELVHKHRASLSPRERIILDRSAEGRRLREIAEELHLSVSSVSGIRSRVLASLHAMVQ
jgi:RNA polymerase sigma factor (sigma-70 family)